MLSTRIQGGLGNQLFMVFATIAYGLQHNVKVIFEYYYQTGERHTYWETLLDKFKVFTTANHEYGMSNYDISHFTIYNEPEFLYRQLPDFGENNVYMIGYFQSYKYFENYKEHLYTIMNLEEKRKVVMDKYSQYFDAQKTMIAIHFRLGDYKSKRYYHPVMNYEYFESSLDYIMANKHLISNEEPDNKMVRVLYFCEQEDNDYVGSKIELLKQKHAEVEFVKVDDTIEDYEQLLIMSCCHHNVMSNSSYSWWGSYLNNYESKIVCFPSKWFGEYYEHMYDHRDMMPESWIRITSDPIPWDRPLV
jgi:hypothetical protein